LDLVKVLAAVDLSGELGRIAARGARYGFPGWPRQVELKNGRTRLDYLSANDAEEKARECIAVARSAGELAGRLFALVADSTPPTAPTGLTAAAQTSTQVDLSWTASTDNVGVAGYRVFRSGAQIGTTTSTNYADSTVSAGQTYDYHVVAYDGAGNTSTASNTATVTTPAGGGGGGGGGGTVTATLVGDAYVRADQPATNFGSSTSIHVDGSPVKQLLLKFLVSGVGTQRVTSAKLRLYNVDASNAGGDFHAANSAWDEPTVNWNTRPSFDATTVASLGSVAPGNWYEVDVTRLVTGDGPVSIIATSASTNGADYGSKQGAAAQAPQLVVTTG
jgi:chitodextrinase